MSGTKPSNLQLVERTIEIIDYIARQGRPVSLKEVVEATGISKPSVHRILSTLTNYRVLIRDGHVAYIPGPRILGWSRSCSGSQGLLSVARPWLDRVWNHVGETIHLVSFEHGEAYYLFKMESRHPLQMRSRMGDPISLHSTAAGKAILFSLPQKELCELSEKSRLEAKTENTITDPAELKRQVERFRQLGYSEEIEENERDIRCVAAPILNNQGYPVGAVSVTCPTYRCGDEKARELGLYLADVIPNISFELGYRPREMSEVKTR